MAVDTTNPQNKPGIISDVVSTGGDMLGGGLKTGLKTFLYVGLAGVALAGVGAVGVIAGIMGAVGFGVAALAGVGALLGLGLMGSAHVLGGIGFGVGAIMGPSNARDRRAGIQQQVNGPVANAPTVQQELQQQSQYNRQLKGNYAQLASDVSAQSQSAAFGGQPQVNHAFAGYENPNAKIGHVNRVMNERAASQAMSADPTARSV